MALDVTLAQTQALALREHGVKSSMETMTGL
jgi:hypothetical protein